MSTERDDATISSKLVWTQNSAYAELCVLQNHTSVTLEHVIGMTNSLGVKGNSPPR